MLQRWKWAEPRSAASDSVFTRVELAGTQAELAAAVARPAWPASRFLRFAAEPTWLPALPAPLWRALGRIRRARVIVSDAWLPADEAQSEQPEEKAEEPWVALASSLRILSVGWPRRITPSIAASIASLTNLRALFVPEATADMLRPLVKLQTLSIKHGLNAEVMHAVRVLSTQHQLRSFSSDQVGRKFWPLLWRTERDVDKNGAHAGFDLPPAGLTHLHAASGDLEDVVRLPQLTSLHSRFDASALYNPAMAPLLAHLQALETVVQCDEEWMRDPLAQAARDPVIVPVGLACATQLRVLRIHGSTIPIFSNTVDHSFRGLFPRLPFLEEFRFGVGEPHNTQTLSSPVLTELASSCTRLRLLELAFAVESEILSQVLFPLLSALALFEELHWQVKKQRKDADPRLLPH